MEIYKRRSMCQLYGYGDGIDRVCELVKTLHGLKQSGHEWNREFENKMKSISFHSLNSNPCVYIQRDADGASIITIWMNDL